MAVTHEEAGAKLDPLSLLALGASGDYPLELNFSDQVLDDMQWLRLASQLVAQELKHTYDSNKDRVGLFASGDRGQTNFKVGFRDDVLMLGGQTDLTLWVEVIDIDDFTASYGIRAHIMCGEVGFVDATIHSDSVIKWRRGRL